ncbi:MAG: hypothetical protein EOP60_09335 [Sphingomonadales bacterium]|nr:MAG: hypothetical protein EOP60_09335 [Sphingomonadales bacterium]
MMKAFLLPAAICLASLSACGKPSDPVQNAASVENVVVPAAETPATADPAPANATATAKPLALDPLKDGDESGMEPGCFCSFATGNDQLLQVAATKAILRIDGALKICNITQEQSSALSGGEGAFTCEGYRITVKGQGEMQQMGEDTSGRDATLTIARGTETKTYKGGMGCAC